MVSQRIWDALSKEGREKYAPLMGKTFKHIPTGFVGVATNYTLAGQLCLKGEKGYGAFWADECEEVKA